MYFKCREHVWQLKMSFSHAESSNGTATYLFDAFDGPLGGSEKKSTREGMGTHKEGKRKGTGENTPK